MEEIINSVMQSPENTNPNVLRGQLQKMGGSGGGSGVLMVTDTDGTLDKTMGEIQDAYLAGKRVIISIGDEARDVIGIVPIDPDPLGCYGAVETYEVTRIDLNDTAKIVFGLMNYSVSGETEEAARNAYPAHLE